MKNLFCLLLLLSFGCNRDRTIAPKEFGADPIIENEIIRYQILAFVAEKKSITAIYSPQDICLDNLVSLDFSICADTIKYRIEMISDDMLISKDVKDRPQYIRKLEDVYVACYNKDNLDSGMPIEEIVASLRNFNPKGISIIYEGEYWILNYVKDNVLIKTIHSYMTDEYQKLVYPI